MSTTAIRNPICSFPEHSLLQRWLPVSSAPQGGEGREWPLTERRLPNVGSSSVANLSASSLIPRTTRIYHATRTARSSSPKLTRRPEEKKLDLGGFRTPPDRDNRAFGTI